MLVLSYVLSSGFPTPTGGTCTKQSLTYTIADLDFSGSSGDAVLTFIGGVAGMVGDGGGGGGGLT